MRIIARDSITAKKSFMIRIIGVVCALATGAVFLAIAGFNPFSAIGSLVAGAFGTEKRIIETVDYAIPLVITSLGIALAFRMKFWNIGAEGQICMGAFAASYFALFHADWPLILLYPVMIISAFAAGALWAAIPALFKVKWGTNETLVTLMFKLYRARIYRIPSVRTVERPCGGRFAKIAMFDKRALLPKLFGINIGCSLRWS